MRVVRDTEGMTGDRERQADTIRQEYWRVGTAGHAPQECLPVKRIRMSMIKRYAVSPGYQGANRSSNNCYSVSNNFGTAVGCVCTANDRVRGRFSARHENNQNTVVEGEAVFVSCYMARFRHCQKGPLQKTREPVSAQGQVKAMAKYADRP